MFAGITFSHLWFSLIKPEIGLGICQKCSSVDFFGILSNDLFRVLSKILDQYTVKILTRNFSQVTSRNYSIDAFSRQSSVLQELNFFCDF